MKKFSLLFLCVVFLIEDAEASTPNQDSEKGHERSESAGSLGEIHHAPQIDIFGSGVLSDDEEPEEVDMFGGVNLNDMGGPSASSGGAPDNDDPFVYDDCVLPLLQPSATETKEADIDQEAFGDIGSEDDLDEFFDFSTAPSELSVTTAVPVDVNDLLARFPALNVSQPQQSAFVAEFGLVRDAVLLDRSEHRDSAAWKLLNRQIGELEQLRDAATDKKDRKRIQDGLSELERARRGMDDQLKEIGKQRKILETYDNDETYERLEDDIEHLERIVKSMGKQATKNFKRVKKGKSIKKTGRRR